MALPNSIRRRLMIVTPRSVLEIWCRHWPKFVIELLRYWADDRNPKVEFWWLMEKEKDLPSIAKKMSVLSSSAILNLLKQDESLWPFPTFPYILLQLIYDLGGKEGREKVEKVVMVSRKIVGNKKQGEILGFLKTDTVVDLLEGFVSFERKRAISNSKEEAVAAWLVRWDARARESEGSLQSPTVLADLPGGKAYRIKYLMRIIEQPWGLGSRRYETRSAE